MKHLLLMLISVPVSAQVFYTSTNTITQSIVVCSSGAPVTPLTSGYGVTNVAAATSSGTLGGYKAIQVSVTAPVAGSSTTVCGFDVALSTTAPTVTAPSPWYGIELSSATGPGAGNVLNMFYVPSYRPLYCATKGNSGDASYGPCTTLTVTQFK